VRPDDPLGTIPGPGSLAKAACGVKYPGPYALGHRVPADPLRGRRNRHVPEGSRESRNDEVFVLRPDDREPFDLSLARFPSPVPDCPLQTAQVLAIAGQSERRLTDAAQKPLPFFFDMDDTVAAPTGRSTVRTNHFGRPMLDGDIRRHETQREAVDSQPQALV